MIQYKITNISTHLNVEVEYMYIPAKSGAPGEV